MSDGGGVLCFTFVIEECSISLHEFFAFLKDCAGNAGAWTFAAFFFLGFMLFLNDAEMNAYTAYRAHHRDDEVSKGRNGYQVLL